MNCLAEAINSVYHTHSDTSDNRRGNFIFPDINKTVQCTLCNFTDTYNMFEELVNNDRGLPAATINRQLAVFMTKSAISYNDARLLFSSLEIPPLSKTALTRQVNYVSPK